MLVTAAACAFALFAAGVLEYGQLWNGYGFQLGFSAKRRHAVSVVRTAARRKEEIPFRDINQKRIAMQRRTQAPMPGQASAGCNVGRRHENK